MQLGIKRTKIFMYNWLYDIPLVFSKKIKKVKLRKRDHQYYSITTLTRSV